MAELHPKTSKLIDDFSVALKDKLARAQEKYGRQDEWSNPDLIEDLALDLCDHMEKGDPRDVAAYCAFLWFHNASTLGEIRG